MGCVNCWGAGVPKRVDANQPQIVADMRSIGAETQSLHMVGEGCADQLVYYNETLFVIEIKTEKGKLTPKQKAWHKRFPAKIARTSEEAFKIIGARWER